MNLIEQLNDLCTEYEGGALALSVVTDLRAIIEQAKREAVEPIAYTDSDNNYLEWTIEALCEKAVCSKNDAIPLYTAPQPDHTKLIGELVRALDRYSGCTGRLSDEINALLTKAREAIK